MNLQNRLVKVGFKKIRNINRENLYVYKSNLVELFAVFRNNSVMIKMFDHQSIDSSVEKVIFRDENVKNINSFKDVLDFFPIKIRREIKLNNILRRH